MPQPPAERDLFKTSTMTFGQHLEELRACLFRAIFGLVLGCAIGLLPPVSGAVIKFIQNPVHNALIEYYQKQAEAKVLDPETRALLREAGYTEESDLDRVGKIVAAQQVSMEVVLMDPKLLARQLHVHVDPAAGTEPATAAPPQGESTMPAVTTAESQGLRRVVLFRPIADDPKTRMNALNSQEAFMIYMKASLLVGAVLASPWVFYQIWSFVATGLYQHERRYVHMFLPMSLFLFFAGAAVAFCFAFEKVLSFLLSFNSMLGINPELRINEWMSFVLLLPLGFGISFQLPLVMLFLERIGLCTVAMYLSSWRLAVLVIFVIAMILTPSPDPYSMCLMAVPLTVLYFGGVWLCKLLPKGKSRFG